MSKKKKELMGVKEVEPKRTSPAAQQSEVHESTADASTAATADGDAETTRVARSAGKSIHVPIEEMRIPEMSATTHIVQDDTDNGGPLVIVSDDPELNPPHAPIDPFPTLGTPQIDLPVKT